MRHLHRLSVFVLFALLVPVAIAGQTTAGASAQRAAQTITTEDIRRRIGIVADDTMRGRDTPSPELEKVAAYIAGEYRRLGLKPAGDKGTFIQRYALDQVRVVPDSTIAFVHGAEDATLRYEKDFFFLDNTLEHRDYMGELVLISGSLDGPIQLDTAALAGKVFVFLMRNRSPAQRRRALTWRPAALLVLSPAPDSAWTAAVAQIQHPQLRDPGSPLNAPVIAIARYGSLAPLLARLGGDLTALQRPTGPLMAQTLSAQLHLHRSVRVVERESAPNVVAILEGSDPQLRREHIVFSAHMDHVGVAGPRGSGGCRAPGADSICNGADDDGSGTVAVVELAEAFAQLSPRPKRSLIFLNVSGEEKGLWGSAYFAEHPAVPINNIVANLNIDMIGRNWKDTIVAIGREHSDLGATLDRVAARHAELNMRPINDPWPNENFYGRSDHYNFARKGVPILFFFSGVHHDYHQPGDSPEKIDAEKESRVAKLIFYLGLEVANAASRPKWNPGRQVVSGN